MKSVTPCGHQTLLMVACGFVLSIAFSSSAAVDNDARAQSIGRRIADFGLTDIQSEQQWQLAAQGSKKAIVLYFLSTECPVTNRYIPTLNELYEELAQRSVAVVAIHSNAHDSIEAIKKHAGDFNVNLPLLDDSDGVVARTLAVSSTAEAIVLDSTRKIRYRGPIDDRFERGVTRPRVSRTLLVDAVDAVLNGRPVKSPLVGVAACPLNLADGATDVVPISRQEHVTYADHVAQIIQARCRTCHRPNGIGPFQLETYRDAKAWAPAIRGVLIEGLMPPWSADAPPGYLANDRSLTDREYRILLDWIDSGAPQGDTTSLPESESVDASWAIGTPDLIIEMNKAIAVPADTPEFGVPYKYIWAGDVFESETWVTAAQVRPGVREVVHHASVYVVPPDVPVTIKDDALPSGPVNDFFSPLNSLQVVVAFVPGDSAFVLADGFAKRIPAGARLLFEMHYTPNGREVSDRTEVGLIVTDVPPKHEILGGAAYNFTFSIPPGDPDYEARAMAIIDRDIRLVSLNAHMHYRGRAFKYELVQPNGDRSLLLDIPRYSFDWQTTYFLSDPIAIARGSRIECTAVFDNSSDNPWNPDPKVRVSWGDQTWQEMMIGYFEYYEDR